jgi:polysaccharide export outer membrane protein
LRGDPEIFIATLVDLVHNFVLGMEGKGPAMRPILRGVSGTMVALLVAGCHTPPPPPPPSAPQSGSEYIIGPGDALYVFVWRNPDLSMKVPVRPDGRISIPLVPDVVAVGKTTSGLGREMEQRLQKYLIDPNVTVIVESFVGPFSRQVRVIGEAAEPRAIPYRTNMTVLDAMIEAGGLTKYAAGNRAILVRTVNGEQKSYSLQLSSLIKDGDVSANVALAPGDIIIIPQRVF